MAVQGLIRNSSPSPIPSVSNTYEVGIWCKDMPEFVLVFEGAGAELELETDSDPEVVRKDELVGFGDVDPEEGELCDVPEVVPTEDGNGENESETLGVATAQNCCISCSAVPRSCEHRLFVQLIISVVNCVELSSSESIRLFCRVAP